MNHSVQDPAVERIITILTYKGKVEYMYKFTVWVRLNQLQTTHVVIYADNGLYAKQQAEAQYGAGNVLNYTQINE